MNWKTKRLDYPISLKSKSLKRISIGKPCWAPLNKGPRVLISSAQGVIRCLRRWLVTHQRAEESLKLISDIHNTVEICKASRAWDKETKQSNPWQRASPDWRKNADNQWVTLAAIAKRRESVSRRWKGWAPCEGPRRITTTCRNTGKTCIQAQAQTKHTSWSTACSRQIETFQPWPPKPSITAAHENTSPKTQWKLGRH